MPIYRHKSCVIYFAHVPKCGGTSVEAYLQSCLGAPAFLMPRYRARAGKVWTVTSPQHVAWADMARLFPADFFDESFAVVRHPVDRILSAYVFQRDVEKTLPESVDLDDFINRLARPRFRNRPVFDNHFRLQSDIVPPDAKVFRLEDGLDAVKAHIDKLADGTDKTAEIGRRLAGKSDKPVLTAEQRARLERIYAADFERFGYDRSEGAAQAIDSATGRVFAIKTCAPNATRQDKWGDHHFAVSLAAALERRGHAARILPVADWANLNVPGQFDIVLRGTKPYDGRDDVPYLMWVLYPGINARQALTERELAGAGQLAYASAVPVQAGQGRDPILMSQAFDPTIMFPPDAGAERSGLVFVGNNYGRGQGAIRPIVALALEAGEKPDLYGPGWENTDAAPHQKAAYTNNANLGDLYRGAEAVLCDHRETMRRGGYVSNRIFDALACGTPVICDDLNGLPKPFAPHVFCCRNADDFAKAVRTIRSESAAKKTARRKFAEKLRDQHCFDARAAEIEQLADKLAPIPKPDDPSQEVAA